MGEHIGISKFARPYRGRPPKLTPKEIKTSRALLKSADIPVAEIAARFHIARSTLYRAILKPASEPYASLRPLPPLAYESFPFLSWPPKKGAKRYLAISVAILSLTLVAETAKIQEYAPNFTWAVRRN